MSQYTLTIQQIVNSNVKIFDFDYPIFRKEFKDEFEKMFIDYFFFEEIAHETVGQFKKRLESKLNLVMPKYNKLFESQQMELRILDNYDVKEIYTRKMTGDANTVSKNLFKDAPKSKIDVDKFDVVSALSKDETTASTSGNEQWERTMKGTIGIQTDADSIVKYWKSIRNVAKELFENELSELFMGVF